MKPPFIHLHTHSHYSLLDGLSQIDKLVALAKEYDMPALALTDHGNMYGAIEFYKTCLAKKIKPIIGVEAYIANRTRFDKDPRIDNKRYHLTLLAKNKKGYENLMKLVTASHLEGFYYKPRMDLALLREYTEGLICLSGCFGSELSHAIRDKDMHGAEHVAQTYRDIFGADNYYFEIMHHPGVPGLMDVRAQIVELSKKMRIPLIATADSHYLHLDDARAHETLLAIQTNSDMNDENRFSMASDHFAFIDTDTAYEYFKDTPEAIENTREIANACNLSLELGQWVFPDLKIENGKTYDDELRSAVYIGLLEKNLPKTDEIEKRIEYELAVIAKKGYAPYFLVVADLLKFAKEHDIYTTIRGSVAGSLVTYLIDITKVNPIEYKLPFERFLNPERPSAPDIDMDYADNRRDEVIQYAREKYGVDKVAQIGTFGTMLARGVVRDVARALGHPYTIGDKISRLIPPGSQGFPMTINRALRMEPELEKMYKTDPIVTEIIDLGKKLEGCVRHVSVHAAGVVIAPRPLNTFVPTQLDPKGGKVITQYDMHAVEDAGLLKFDFLGIRNLSILADAVKIVREAYNINLDIEKIPLDDSKTFSMLTKGETMGLFQLNGAGTTRYLKELKPSSIHDINAMVSLYRPGPMESIPRYIERKHNPALVTYLDPRMKDILRESYGVITYQDDVLLIAIQLAGYSWLEADKLRKAMGKKIPAVMEAEKEKLKEGLTRNGMSAEKAEELWHLIEPFAAYGFNKCLTGDTRIIDTKSGRPWTIRELYESKHTISVHTMNAELQLESQPIGAVIENGIKPVFALRTRSGRIITATANHPFHTINGWKTLDTLTKGIRIATPRTLPTKGKHTEREHPAIGTKDSIPADILINIRHAMAIHAYTPKTLSCATGLAPRLFMHDTRKIGYQRSVIQKIGTILKEPEITAYATSDIYWDEIASIKPAGKEMTYDLTVPPHHNFVANDIIVHNSHAASYGRVAYQTAYMKANYPTEYMTAVLTADSGDVEKIAEIVAECKRMGIAVLPPDINESFGQFTIVRGQKDAPAKIRFGLYSIKNFGEGIGNAIITERSTHGPFASLTNFLERIKDRNLNKKSLEALVQCGALDQFEERGIMLGNMDQLLVYNKEAGRESGNQMSLFGALPTTSIPGIRLEPATAAAKRDKLRWEKELLGLYISGHPLDAYQEKLASRKTNIQMLRTGLQEGMLAVASGIVSGTKSILTKRGDKMLFLSVQDFTGTLEVVVFPNVLSEYGKLLHEENCVAVKGRISKRNGTVSMIAETVKEL